MKTRVISAVQAGRSWERLIDLQLRGYVFIIKRNGRRVARLESVRNTISRAMSQRNH